VLVLSGGALVFAAGEARAQQRPVPEMPATVTELERTPVSDAELAGPTTATLPADSPPSQVDERDAWSSSSPEPDLVMPGAPEPALALLEELYPAYWTDLLPEAAMPESFGVTFGPALVSDPAVAMLDPGPVPPMGYTVPFVDPPPAPGQAGFGPALPYPGLTPEPAWGPIVSAAYKPLPPRIEEKPLALSPKGTPEGVRPAPFQGNGVANPVPVGPLPPVAGGVDAAHPEVYSIDSADPEFSFSDVWHTDVTFMEKPPMGSLLRAVELPSYGGDTSWVDSQLAYESLAAPVQQLVDQLTAVHDGNREWGHFLKRHLELQGGVGYEWDGEQVTELVPVEHPVVRVHPETGRKGLFVNPGFTSHIVGVSDAESRGILDLLFAHLTKPEHTIRHRWQSGDLGIWDNRSTSHYANRDYTEKRVMHRITLQGDKPFGPRG